MLGAVERACGGETAGSRLVRRVDRLIALRGPLPVSQYVDVCLYDPEDGFYMREGGRSGGSSGHFLTAPTAGPLFGEVLARALDAWWDDLGRPVPFTVIDWGAGPGALARSVLAADARCVADGALRWVAVELSAAQRAVHIDHPMAESVAHVREALPDGVDAGVVIANELLDNLPFDIVRRTEAGWDELRVTTAAAAAGAPAGTMSAAAAGAPADACSGRGSARMRRSVGTGDMFSLVSAPASEELTAMLPEAPLGTCLPVQQAARRWVWEAHGVLGSGRIVVFDYGADTKELAARQHRGNALRPDGGSGEPETAGPAPRGASGALAAASATAGDAGTAASAERAIPGDCHAMVSAWLRTHRRHSSAVSWLAVPGACDITVDVALDQVQADYPAEVRTQADFLRAHGMDGLVARGRAVWSEHAGVCDLTAIRARSRVSEAEALSDTGGFGAFCVLDWVVG